MQTRGRPVARLRPTYPARTRRRRRLAVAATYGGYIALVVIWRFSRHVDTPWQPWVFALTIPAALIALVGLGGLLTSQLWRAANEPDDVLDEREQRVRDRAYLHSYQVLAAIVVVGGAYISVAWDTHARLGLWLPQTWNEVQAIFWGLLLLAATLPVAVIGWTEPDLPAESD